MPLYNFASGLLAASFFLTCLASFRALQQVYSENAVTAAPKYPQRPPFYLDAASSFFPLALTVLLTVCSVILLYAFIAHDFRVEYVAQYSDKNLPLFYRITAFWAGQDGSLLFWAWSVVLGGGFFALTPSFKKLSRTTRLWYAVFFYSVMAFFLILLFEWSNPFNQLDFTPRDGQGLNPLLQNPGMIFHPPLLFLGYGGFVVPGCLALAQTMSGRLFDAEGAPGVFSEEPWGQASRPFILIGWSFLTAGIVLGAWWAYMELGWGGYWAWDPVENASLIPWLIGSAYLHTGVIGSRRGKLHRTNVFLMALTTVSAFFATYLVRSGVVQSLHAFGSGTVGIPLVSFTLFSLVLAFFIAVFIPGGPLEKRDERQLEDLTSKEGLLLMVAWLLLAISVYILIATMWPVIIDTLLNIKQHLPQALGSRLPSKPMGLEPAFYNRTCLPLFALLSVLLVFCPFRKWRLPENGFSGKTFIRFCLFAAGGVIVYGLAVRYGLGASPASIGSADFALRVLPAGLMLGTALYLILPEGDGSHASGFSQPRDFGFILLALVIFIGILTALGITQPVALLAAACSLAAILGIAAIFAGKPALLRVRATLAAHGTHLGLLLTVLGVAFSGPYQQQYTVEIGRNQATKIGAYQVMLNELYEGSSQTGKNGVPNFHFLEAELLIADEHGSVLGRLSPQRRVYANFDQQTYAEVDTIFSLGNEIYATLLSLGQDNRATLAVNINPLVNWLWIGGTLMCIFPLFSLARTRRERDDVSETAEAHVSDVPARQ